MEVCENLSSKKKVPPMKKLLKSISKMLLTDDEFVLDFVLSLDSSELARDHDDEECYEECTEDTKMFARLLYYYSPKAYNYVITKYDTRLPPVPILRTWYVHEGGVPGFTEETLTAIGEKANRAQQKLHCTVIVEEFWDYHAAVNYVDGEGYYGFHEIGARLDTDCNNRASTVLVMSVAAINASWNLPIGYFLLCGDGSEKIAVLVKTAIFLLEQKGVEVLALTLPWHSKYKYIPKELGAKVIDDKTTFKEVKFHSESGKEIVVIPDIRSLLNEILWVWEMIDEFKDSNGSIIAWKCINDFEKLYEGATKSKKNRSFIFNDYKFTNRIAALLRHRDAINTQKFPGSEATINFLNLIDDMLDIFNMKPNVTEQPKPVNDDNKGVVIEKLDAICDCFVNITKPKPEPHVDFIGFGIAIKGLKEIMRLHLNKGILKDILLNKTTSLPIEEVFALVKQGSGTKKRQDVGARAFKIGYNKAVSALLAEFK